MQPILSSFIYIAISCLMLFVSRILFDRFAPFKIEEQIKEKNATAIIVFLGYLLGIVCVLAGAFVGPESTSFKLDFVLYCAYAIAGIGLMTLSGIVIDKLLLNKFDCKKEILEDKNIGTAAVYFATYLATGLIASSCVNGEYGGILSSIIYYVLGIIFMILFIKLYDFITPYSVHEELEKDNYAVGIALAGNIIAMGLILMKATLGDADTIKDNVILYFTDLAAIFLLLPIVRLILCNFIVRHIKMNEEIKNNNVSAGILEFASIVCFAIVIFFMADFTLIL